MRNCPQQSGDVELYVILYIYRNSEVDRGEPAPGPGTDIICPPPDARASAPRSFSAPFRASFSRSIFALRGHSGTYEMQGKAPTMRYICMVQAYEALYPSLSSFIFCRRRSSIVQFIDEACPLSCLSILAYSSKFQNSNSKASRSIQEV